MDCKEAQELLPAHVDRELGVRESVEIDKHLLSCFACQAEYAKQQAAQAAVKRRATYYVAPGHLGSRIRLALPSDVASPPAPRTWNWYNVGAALLSVVAITVSIGLYRTLPTAGDRLADEIVAEHVRSLMLNHATDVLSSDRHTVKPWFAGKLDFSPPVYDLATAGFPLVGGRLDYLEHRPVAALVYRFHQHLINLFVAPAPGGKAVPAQSLSRQGYHLVSWSHAGMVYWAVSDVEPAELDRFREILLARTKLP